jgi:hypothetical protein
VTRIRRGGYIFLTWIGDHPPRHVHVYRDEEFVVKWDLERNQALEGSAPSRVVALINELLSDGRI